MVRWLLATVAIWPCIVLGADVSNAPAAVNASLPMGAARQSADSSAHTITTLRAIRPVQEDAATSSSTPVSAALRAAGFAGAAAAPDPSADAEMALLPGQTAKGTPAMKEVVETGQVVLSSFEDTYQSKMPVRDFLAAKLGAKFHPRVEWAGTGPEFSPKLATRRTWDPIGPVRVITIHHATEIKVEEPVKMIRRIFRGHTSATDHLDAADIGYHFLVDSKGEVWEGRDAAIMGTHVRSNPSGLNNRGNLGICGLGSFAKTNPPKAMVDGIVNLTSLLCDYYGRPLGVRGHDDWYGINRFLSVGGTDCPGRLEQAVLIARRLIETKYQMASGDLERMTEVGENRSLVAIATKR